MRIMNLRRKYVHKFVWYLKPEHYLTSEEMGYDLATVVKEMGCKNYERMGCIGPLAKFVDKDSKIYQWAELNITVRYYYYYYYYYYYMTFAGRMFST
jgi:hypothetical protein